MSANTTGESVKSSPEQPGLKDISRRNMAVRPTSLPRIQISVIVLGCIALVAIIALILFSHSRDNDKNTIVINGRIEAPETHISAVCPTRVRSVLVKEGDRVAQGQLLIELDTGVIKAKAGDVQQFIAQSSKANNVANQHARAVQQQVSEAQKKSRGFWARVFTSPKGRAKKGEALRGEMLQARLMQMQARVAVAKAHAMAAAVSSAKANFKLKSPISGICETRSIEPGELVAAGQVLLTIVDPKRVYMKGYIAEGDIGKIKIGQKADVYLDCDSRKAHPAQIASIDRAPSFTPENVYFKDDRVRQVFGVKLDLENPDGLAKPGMPAEAKVSLTGQNQR